MCSAINSFPLSLYGKLKWSFLLSLTPIELGVSLNYNNWDNYSSITIINEKGEHLSGGFDHRRQLQSEDEAPLVVIPFSINTR